MVIEKVPLPAKSQLHNIQQGAYYADAFRYLTNTPNASPLAIWLRQMQNLPSWVIRLMELRNKLAFLFGIENTQTIHHTPAFSHTQNYQVGDSIGFFKLEFLSDNEAVLIDADKHLTVRISIYKSGANSNQVTISSHVIVHNLSGKLYMLFVAPLHRKIVPASIRKVERLAS